MTPQQSNYTFAELQGLVIDWAVAKPITDLDAQTLKIYEELGELSKAIIRKDQAQIIDGIGDVAVTIVIANHLAKGYGLIISDVDYSFNSISNNVSDILLNVLDRDYKEAIESLMFLSKTLGYNLTDCLATAYNIIKDRKGTMQNGSFVKEQDYDFIKPDHYKNNSGFDVINAWQSFNMDALLGIILKHFARLGKKPTDSVEQDLRKILEYINRGINPPIKTVVDFEQVAHSFSDNPKVQECIEYVFKAQMMPLRKVEYLEKVAVIVKELLGENEIK